METARRGQRGRWTLLGTTGGLFAVAVPLTAIGYAYYASTSLDDRVTALAADVEAFDASRRADRPPLLGQEPTPGNAADDYRAIEWIFGRAGDWPQDPPPGTPEPALSRLDDDASGRLIGLFGALDDDAGPLDPELAALARRCLPALEHVRAGLAREDCRWDSDLSAGLKADIPDLVALRLAAALMAFEAREAPPERAARIGLEVVAFGRDLGRHPSVIGLMIGVSIETMGLRALERTLARPLPAPVLEEVRDTLARLDPPDLRQALEAERLSSLASLAEMAGHPLDADADQEGSDWLRATWVDHEWGVYEDHFARWSELALRPYSARRARASRVEEEVAGSWSLVAGMLPDLPTMADHVDSLRASRAAVAALAAAHLHRLERGALPADREALTAYLEGGLALDPFHWPDEAPLRVCKEGDRLIVYSWGADGDDDGGRPREDDDGDLVFETRDM